MSPWAQVPGCSTSIWDRRSARLRPVHFAAEDTPEEAIDDAAKAGLKAVDDDAIGDASTAVPEHALVDGAEDAIEDTFEDTTDDAAKDACKAADDNATDNASTDAPVHAFADGAEDDAQDTPEDATDAAAEDALTYP